MTDTDPVAEFHQELVAEVEEGLTRARVERYGLVVMHDAPGTVAAPADESGADPHVHPRYRSC